MANIKSQKKRIITNEKARVRNRAVRSELKTATRAVQDAVDAENGQEAIAAAHKACRLLDRAVSKGVIHKRQAANRKSGLMILANGIATDEERKAYKPAEKVAPEKKGGTKKAAAKEARKKEMEKATKEKAKRRTETEKSQAAAAKKKAADEKKAAEEAAKEEKAAAEDASTEEKPAEEAAE